MINNFIGKIYKYTMSAELVDPYGCCHDSYSKNYMVCDVDQMIKDMEKVALSGNCECVWYDHIQGFDREGNEILHETWDEFKKRVA